MRYRFNQAQLESLPDSSVETMLMSLAPEGYKMDVFWVRYSGNFGSCWVNGKGEELCLYLRTSKGGRGTITGSVTINGETMWEIELSPDSQEFKKMIELGIYTEIEP